MRTGSDSGKVTTSIWSIYYNELLKKKFSDIAFVHGIFAVKFQEEKFNKCFQKDSITFQIFRQ